MSLPFIFLDQNSTTRMLPEVRALLDELWQTAYANPGSRHLGGRASRKILEQSRERLAELLGAEPDEVVFTSGGTEASNLALRGLWRGAGIILLTEGEHPATRETCQQLAAGFEFLKVDRNGILREDQWEKIGWESIRLSTLILAHNETGVIQDLTRFSLECKTRGIPFHLDAVQAVGKIPVNFRMLGATTMSIASHKFHGPRGVGALLVARGTRLVPIFGGGHQESGRRPGTESVPLIAAMVHALELWDQTREQRTQHVVRLRNKLQELLCTNCSPVVINGAEAPRLPNTLHIAFPGLDGEALLVALDLANIGCSLGSTCASGSSQPAPALVAMGAPPEVIRASLRFSVGCDNTLEEIEEAARRIVAIVSQMRTRSC